MKGAGILALVSGAWMLTACTTTVKLKVLEPAQIDRAAHTKQIAVSPFEGDTVGLAGKIEATLAKQKLDGQYYFTTVSRKEVDQLLQEQQFQYSGVVNENRLVEAGELLGAQAFVAGEVTSASARDDRHYEERMECANKKCNEYRVYNVACQIRTVSMGANIKVIDVSKGDIIHADSFTKSRRWKHCRDDSRTLPTKSAGLELLASEIATDFVHRLTPHYTTMTVTLLDDPDMDYSAEQKKTLSLAIEYIEAGRLDKAERLLGTLLDSTDNRSYVAAYDLGVVKEAQGDLAEARRLYHLADDLQVEPVDEINEAVKRIDRVMVNREKALSQISQ